MPKFFASCVSRSLIKTVPQLDGLTPFRNSKQFETENPSALLLDYYRYIDWDTNIIFVNLVADTLEVAKEKIRSERPDLYVRHITEDEPAS